MCCVFPLAICETLVSFSCKFSDPRLCCILQQFVCQLSSLTVNVHIFLLLSGKDNWMKHQVSAFVSWCLLTETDLHFRVYCKACGGCWLFINLSIWLAHPTYYSHALFLSFFLEIGISFRNWDQLAGNGTCLYWHHLHIVRVWELTE